MSESVDDRPQPLRRFLAPRVDCDDVADQAAAFALGALEPAERVNVERHIRSCTDCARLVADLEATAGLLPFVAPPAVPTLAAKTALFARIAQAQAEATTGAPVAHLESSRRSPARRARPAHVSPMPTMLTIPASSPARHPGAVAPTPPVAPAATPSKRWYAVGSPLTTIPLVLALALVTAWSFTLRDQGQVGPDRADVLTERLGPGSNMTTGAEVDTGDGGVESVLGLDGLVDIGSLNLPIGETETTGDLDADAAQLGYVYGGVDVGATVASTVDTLQYGDQVSPTGGEVAIG